MLKSIEILNLSDKLGAKLINKFEKGIKKVSIKKGTILQKKGELSINSFFVQKGLLKSYTIDEKGKEHIFMFAPENWVISDFQAHAGSKPSQLFIEAIEDSEIEIINKNSLKLFKNFPQETLYNEFERLLKRVGVMQDRIIMLMSYSAKERYDEFLITYPKLSQRVSQKLIASYLGITPQALSSIRGNKNII